MSRKRRHFNVDHEATKAAQFQDKNSFVNWEGKEFLGAKDWEIRRHAVYERDEAACKSCDGYVRFEYAEIHHHPVSRGKGGGDNMDNLELICWYCHRQAHVHVKSGKGT